MDPRHVEIVALSVCMFLIAFWIGTGVTDQFNRHIAETLGVMK